MIRALKVKCVNLIDFTVHVGWTGYGDLRTASQRWKQMFIPMTVLIVPFKFSIISIHSLLEPVCTLTKILAKS